MKFEKLSRIEVEAKIHHTKPARVVPIITDSFGNDEGITYTVDPIILGEYLDAMTMFDMAHDLFCDATRRPKRDGQTIDDRAMEIQRLYRIREAAWKVARQSCERMLGISKL